MMTNIKLFKKSKYFFLFFFFLIYFFLFTLNLNAACTSNTSPTANCVDLIINSSNKTIVNNYTITGSGNKAVQHEPSDWANGPAVTGTTITNNSTGVISGSQYGVYLYYSSVSQITNSGIIQNTYLFKTGYNGGIQLSVENTVSPRTVTVGTITNNSGATISGAYGIYNGQVGTINQLVNSGNITGLYGAIINRKNTLTPVIESITNNSGGVIKSTGHTNDLTVSEAITNQGTITSISNSGTIESQCAALGCSTSQNAISNTGTITTITNNSGGIITGSINGLYNTGTITTIINAGDISSSSPTIGERGISNTGTIDTITNTGTITGRQYGIYNSSGTITTLNNRQSSLSFTNKLPRYYNIILGDNASTFGTLIVTSPDYYNGVAGNKTTFGIYSGTVLAKKYSSVITGVSSNYLSTTTGTYGGYSWSLDLQSGSTTTWDLTFPSYVSPTDTDTSLLTVASNLKGVINYQSSSLNHSLNYDCSYFGKSNSCMSSSFRNSNTKDNDSQSVAIIAATKISDQVRVGGFIDGTVNTDHNPNMKLNSNNPMFGAFVRFNQYDQNFGLKGGVSAGYIDQDLKSTRVVTSTSEPGTGTSNLKTTGIQAEIQYGIDAATFLNVSPYVGYRNTQTTRDKYIEETSSTVTSPLTFNKIKQTEKTAFAGIELKSHFHTTDKFATLNLGCEHTTKFSIDNLSTSGVSGTSDVNLGSNIDKTRPVITASLNQDLGTSGRLSLNFDRRQQVYSPTNSSNLSLQYAVGF